MISLSSSCQSSGKSGTSFRSAKESSKYLPWEVRRMTRTSFLLMFYLMRLLRVRREAGVSRRSAWKLARGTRRFSPAVNLQCMARKWRPLDWSLSSS